LNRLFMCLVSPWLDAESVSESAAESPSRPALARIIHYFSDDRDWLLRVFHASWRHIAASRPRPPTAAAARSPRIVRSWRRLLKRRKRRDASSHPNQSRGRRMRLRRALLPTAIHAAASQSSCPPQKSNNSRLKVRPQIHIY